MTKEELKDEMKNRISMALKDPILQQGFECICKENAELKEEILAYIFCSVVFKHSNDDSFKITKEAEDKENKLFSETIAQLRKLDKDNKIFNRE